MPMQCFSSSSGRSHFDLLGSFLKLFFSVVLAVTHGFKVFFLLLFVFPIFVSREGAWFFG